MEHKLNGQFLYSVWTEGDYLSYNTDGNIYWSLDYNTLYNHKYELFTIHLYAKPPTHIQNPSVFMRLDKDNMRLLYIIPFTQQDYDIKSFYIKSLIKINDFKLPDFNIDSHYITPPLTPEQNEKKRNALRKLDYEVYCQTQRRTMIHFLRSITREETLKDTDEVLEKIVDIEPPIWYDTVDMST